MRFTWYFFYVSSDIVRWKYCFLYLRLIFLIKTVNKPAFKGCTNKKSVKVTILAKNKKTYNKVVKKFKNAGLTKATYKFKKAK